MVLITGWVYWQAAGATGPVSHALAKIAIALSATTFVCAVALGVTSPATHGTFAWTTPPVYAWSLITGMGRTCRPRDRQPGRQDGVVMRKAARRVLLVS